MKTGNSRIVGLDVHADSFAANPNNQTCEQFHNTGVAWREL